VWYRHVQKTLTLEEFLKLPETKPASEYIGGQIIQKPMPGSQVAQSYCCTVNKVVRAAVPYQNSMNLWRAIVPDIVVFAWERIPG